MSEVRRDNNANTFKTAASGVKAGATIGSVAGPGGTAIGSVIGGIGGFIGGLFGGAKRRREAARRLEQARVKGINTNTYNMSSAQSDYLTNDYYNTNGTT
jgi:phage-like element PBSX protein xkdO